MSRRVLLAVLLGVAACYHYEPRLLPFASSPEPTPFAAFVGLRAGFGRADITAPPGVGMFCYGPEGRAARGYRQRLYARALVLEDVAGERIGIIAADLCVISPVLHRLVADRIVTATGIGSDRLLMSATHTHSAPSHFFGAKLYNDYGSGVAGFDTVLVEFLVTRMAAAVEDAARDLRPARAAWGMENIWGLTRNRSYEAFVLNDPPASLPASQVQLGLTGPYRAVDPRWKMLRVDVLDVESGRYRPAGAFSIFAIHGTGNPSANDLLDADVHALAQRGLERHIDGLNHRDFGFRPHAVHLIANGTAGDVSPDWSEATRCGAYELRTVNRPAGPRSPPEPEGWCSPSGASEAACLAAARANVDEVGSALARRAIELFDRLGSGLSGDVRIARAFRTVPLKGELAPPELCDEPKVGTSATGGASDGYTRYHEWRFLGLVPIGYEQGGSAVKESNKSCQGPKRNALFPFQKLIAGPHGLPEKAQLTVVRVGGMLIGTVPAEVTTTAGDRMMRAMLREADAEDLGVDSVALVSLTNGYLQYVTTSEEYSAQRYEGGATIYGPGSAKAFEDQLARLVAELDSGSSSGSAGSQIDSIVAYPGKHKSIFPESTAGPAVELIDRGIEQRACHNDTLVVRWLDAYPGRLVPADGPVLRIDREVESGVWRPAVWDDDARLEVRALKARGKRGYLWEARWSPRDASGRYRVVLVAREGLPEITGGSFLACR